MKLRVTCFFLLLTFLASSAPLYAKELKGTVVGVSDGDTITLLKDKKPIKIRLHGIDAPELRQPYGRKAKAFLSDQIFAKPVTVLIHGSDRYGRVVGEVYGSDGSLINEQIVLAGLAWWYHQYAPHSQILQIAEQKARAKKRGLWLEPTAIAPWEWRKNKKASSKSQ